MSPMRALVTGAGGFIGSHLARTLALRGHDVRGLVRHTTDLRNLAGVEVPLVYGDILMPSTLDPALEGREVVFHTASPYTYWGISEAELLETTVTGTRNVMEAAVRQGVRRVVLTSSSVVAGSRRTARVIGESEALGVVDEPAYVRAKAEQERLAFELGHRLGIEVVAVRPTITVGGPDVGLTESNRMLVRYLTDPLKATWIGGCNIVGVDDVVAGHLLAAEHGAAGERYVLGSENLEWPAVHKLISDLVGLPGPWLTAWETHALAAAAVFEWTSRLTGKPPQSSREQARMVGRYYWYDHEKARALGYRPASARQALAGALAWLVASDHVPNDVRARMTLAPECSVYARTEPGLVGPVAGPS